MKKLPVNCPSCEQPLQVSELSCLNCDTVISGNYELPALLQLSLEDQEFILQFVRFGGSLKKMASQMNKSYPTVRNMLDDLIDRLNSFREDSTP